MTGPTLQNLLDVEFTDEVLGFRFAASGLPMWSYVRFAVLDESLKAAHGLDSRPPAGTAPRTRQMRYVATSWRRRPTTLAPRPVLHVTSAVLNSSQRGGRWFNRLCDDFNAARAEATNVLETAHRLEFRFPRWFPHVAAYDWLKIAPEAAARRGSVSAADEATIDGLLDWLRRSSLGPLLSEDRLATARRLLRRRARDLPFLADAHARMLDRLRPRVLIWNNGYYGGYAHVLRLAHERGIHTAELQHGSIVTQHAAFNFGPAVGRGLADVLPQTLLTWGTFWSGQTAVLGDTQAVGHPALLASIEGYAGTPKRDQILVISQRPMAPLLMAAVRQAAPMLAPLGLRLVYRLHPAEAALRDEYAELERLPGVSLSTGGDLYRELAESRVVFGAYSTVMFESLAFPGLRRFALDHPIPRLYLPEGPFTFVADGDDLAAQLAQGEPDGSRDVGAFYQTDGVRAYTDWLDPLLR